jgi:hypothetical protein
LIGNLADHGAGFWALLPTDWLCNISSGLIVSLRLRRVAPIGRIKWFPDTKQESADNFAWMLFGRLDLELPARFVGRLIAGDAGDTSIPHRT